MTAEDTPTAEVPIAPQVPRLGYVGALDGLRALAVIAVLLFHGGIGWARGGFLGVDMFFVLSGFLITTLLLEELAATGTVRLRDFWTRRARRLLPAMIVVTVAVAAVPTVVAATRSIGSTRLDAASALAYVANWRFIAAGASYFGRTSVPSPLQHTWSLAVEEQFYLVFPLVALLLARRRSVWLGLVAFLGAVASAVTMGVLFHPGQDTSRVYFGTDARVHVILIGVIAAVLLRRWRARDKQPGPWAGAGLTLLALACLAGIGWVMVNANGSTPWLFRGGFAGLSAATALVIAAVVMVPGGWLGKALAIWPLAALGRISYGIYLWHWPLFLALNGERTGLQGNRLLAVRLAATLAVSIVSAWLIERPIRIGRILPGWRAGAALAPLAAALAGVLFLLAVLPQTTATSPAAAAGLTTARAPGSASGSVATSPVPSEADSPQLVSRRPPVPPGKVANVLFVGDSVSMTLAQGLDDVAGRYQLALTNNAILGCGIVQGGPYRYFGQVSPQPKNCDTWPTRWAGDITKSNPDVVALLVGRWEVMDRVHNDKMTHIGDPDFDAYLVSELEQAVQVLTAKGALVAMFTAPYYLRGERPDGGMWPEDATSRVDAFNVLVRQVAARHPTQVALIDLNAKTSTNGRYVNSINGVKLRYDGVHFTQPGAHWLAPWLLPQLNALVPGRGAGSGALLPSDSAPPLTTSTTTPTSRYRTPTTVYRRPSTTSTTVRYSASTTTTSAPETTSTTTYRPTTSTTLLTTPTTKPKQTTTTTSPSSSSTTTP